MVTERVTKNKLDIAAHAIQLNYIGVKEVHFKSDRLPISVDSSKLHGPVFTVGRANYDHEQKTIQVGATIEFSHPEQSDFAFKLSLVAQFRIDDTIFPANKIHDWADKASFYVIFPYLREEVYSLSMRVGMKPIVLPLLQIPTFKLESSRFTKGKRLAAAIG